MGTTPLNVWIFIFPPIVLQRKPEHLFYCMAVAGAAAAGTAFQLILTASKCGCRAMQSLMLITRLFLKKCILQTRKRILKPLLILLQRMQVIIASIQENLCSWAYLLVHTSP